MTNTHFELERLKGNEDPALFAQIAVLHTTLIRGGVLPLLGESFLTRLYREIAQSKFGSVYVARIGSRTTGFIAGTSDVWRCALSFTPAGYGRLLWLLLLRSYRPQVFRKMLGTLAYPFRKSATTPATGEPPDKHRAELLAIAVSSEMQTRGLGRALVLAFERALLEKRVTRYLVATNREEAASNAFYRALGFIEIGQQRHHDLVIQLYTKKLN